MTKLHNTIKTTRLSIWLIACALILAATSVYAAGDQRPLAAVDILGSPDAAVNGQFAVGTTTPGNKALTVAGVIDFVGAGTVHNYFTQGPGNNMQIRSNVDEYNSVGNSSYAQWNMVMGASLDVFSIRRSPAGSTYNEDALFWIEGESGNIGIATVDTGNGATIPFSPDAKLHVQAVDSYAIYSETLDGGVGVFGAGGGNAGIGVQGYAGHTSGYTYGVYGESVSTSGIGVFGINANSSGNTYGVYGQSDSPNGIAVYGDATATTGVTSGVYGNSDSIYGRGVEGYANATTGDGTGVYGASFGDNGFGVEGHAYATTGLNYGVSGHSASTNGIGVEGWATALSGYAYGVHGRSASTSGRGVYGQTYATSGTTYGVYAESASTTGYDFYAAGAGTDYGPFTGAHEVILSESFPAEIQLGMIVSATGETQIRRSGNGDVDFSSTLPTVRLADTAQDPAVLGALVAEVTLPEDHWYTAGEGERFGTVNALGEGRVWVTNINGEIKAGDAVTTSEIPGYGQRQSDDVLHIYTLGKATETVDWETVTDTVIFNGREYKVYLLAVVYMSG